MTSSVDGWVENKGPNPVTGQPSEDFNAREQSAFRIAASWDVTDSVTVDYSYDDTQVDSTPPYYQANGNSASRLEHTEHLFLGNTPFRYVLPEGEMEQSGHNLTITAELSD